MDELTKLWDNAFVAAAKNNRAEVSETSSESKYSQRDKNGFTVDKYFNSQIDKWNELKEGGYVKVGTIGNSHPLHAIGFPAGTIRYDVTKLTKNMTDHADYLTIDILKAIPNVIANPVAISQYTADNTVSVFGNIFVGNSPIMVGITISKDRAGNDITKVRTVNARKDVGKLITDDSILYLDKDKKRTRKWFQAIGIQVPLGGTKFGFIRSVSQSDDNVKYSFAGRKALTADSQSLSQAEKMEKQGKESEEIRQATGWFRGYDGQWRFEIDDSGMEYTSRGDLNFKNSNPDYARYRELVSKAEKFMLGMSNENLTEAENKEMLQLRETWGATFQSGGKLSSDANAQTKLSSYLKHDELFKAYPQLKDTRLEFKALPEKSKGSYNPNTDTITLNESLRNSPEKTLLHEIQHIIQTTEGFAKGANIENGKEQYVKSAGEIEARDTANRRNLSSEQRENTRPDIDQTGVVVNGNSSVMYSQQTDDNNTIKKQIISNQDSLNEMNPVANISISKLPSGAKNIRSWALEMFKSYGYKVDRQGFGIIEFSPKHISEGLRYLSTDGETAAFAALPKVLKRGIEIESHDNHKNRPRDSVTIAAPVEINGVRGNMAVVVSVTTKNHYHVHRILTPTGAQFEFKYNENKTEPTRRSADKISGEEAYDSVYENNVSQSDGNIKYQMREITPLSTEDYEKTEKFFGTTTNYNVAGYLLPDGKMLDFSGKHWGAINSNMRQVDHRDIWDVWENSDRDGIDEMVNMIGNGAIRLMPESAGINLATMPNSKQLSTLRGYINNFRGEVIVDIDQVGGDTVQSFQYSKGTSSSKILSDIQEYFKNGTVPAASSQLGSFRYQMRDNTSGMTREEISSMERSYSRLKTENAENERKWRYWKGQTELTKQQTVRESDVRKFARVLANKYDSTIDVNELAEQLQRMGNMLVQKTGEELSYNELRDMAYDIGRSIVESAEVPQLTGYEDIADEIVSSIKAAKFKVASYKNLPEGFRKEYKGKLHIDRQYSRSADSYYQEWQEQYGYDLFPEDIVNTDDQLVIIADALDRLTSTQMVNPFASNKNEMSIAISNEILDTMLSEEIRQTAPTKADKAASLRGRRGNSGQGDCSH